MGDLVALRLSEALVTILESSLLRNMPASRTISAIWLWVRTISSKRPWNSERGISRIGSSGGTISALGGIPKVFILAEAISDIRQSSYIPWSSSSQEFAAPGRKPVFITTIILTEIASVSYTHLTLPTNRE